MSKKKGKTPIQPVSGTKVPRFAGASTFARLPELRDVESCDVAIVGIPFDAGTSYRPGARFGPQSIRQASRHLRTNYHPAYDAEPFLEQQVADAGDITCNPFNINESVEQIQKGATELLGKVGGIEEKVYMKVDGDLIKAVPEEDVDRTSAEGKASSVQFIHFKFNDEQIKKFKSNSSLVEVGIDHNEYSHSTKLSDVTVKSLSADFN